MSKTTFATNNALTKKIWDEELFQDVQIESFFASRFMGEGMNSLVQVKTQLTKQQGDQITFGIRSLLTGDGVTSGQILEGNEEALQTYDYSVSLEQYRHGVRDRGAMDRQRAMFSIDDEAREALKIWGAEKIDKLLTAAVLASPTKTLYRDSTGTFAGSSSQSTAKAALDSNNSKLTPAFISALRTWAKTGGGGQTYRIRPVKIDGKEMYVLLVNPCILYDLRIDATFQVAMKDAQNRGSDNPLFKSAVAIWDDVVIHESERVPMFTDGGGASVAGSHGVLMGAQALVWAWGKRPETKQETFDYGNEHGYAWEMIAKAGKPKYNSKDYGVVGVTLAGTNIISA